MPRVVIHREGGWHELLLFGRRYRIREVDGKLEMERLDLETEVIAAHLTGTSAPHLHVLQVMQAELEASKPLPEQLEMLRDARALAPSDISIKAISDSRSPAFLALVAAGGNESQRARAAYNSRTHPLTLAMLIDDPSSTVRGAAAQAWRLAPEQYRKLAQDRTVHVRSRVASSTRAPEDVFELLARDPRADVRASLAANKSVPQAILLQLAVDPDTDVRYKLADRADVDGELGVILARDPALSVRKALVERVITDPAPLDVLACDADAEIRYRAAGHRLSRAAQERLAEDPDPKVRGRLAANRATDVDLVIKLAQDRRKEARLGAAQYRDLPDEWLEKLSQDRSYEVARLAKGRLRQRHLNESARKAWTGLSR